LTEEEESLFAVWLINVSSGFVVSSFRSVPARVVGVAGGGGSGGGAVVILLYLLFETFWTVVSTGIYLYNKEYFCILCNSMRRECGCTQLVAVLARVTTLVMLN